MDTQERAATVAGGHETRVAGPPGRDVLDLREIDATMVALAGGKGASLGELARMEGVRVPPGVCVTTEAFRRAMAGAPSIGDRLDRLSRLRPGDREAIDERSAQIRRTLEAVAIPDDLAAAITSALARLGGGAAYAVRSSATAEDSPAASFAGLHDTFLNVTGPAAVLGAVRRAWASLFSERAVVYRLRNGIDHRAAAMAVVVQRMVVPRAAGVLFTADPATSDRTVAVVEAGHGLGEDLVAGAVDADRYRVRAGDAVTIEARRGERPVMAEAQVVRLARLGRRIEARLGRPQDIEWCLTDDGIEIVQSRPITTLFPIPEPDDGQTHVYVSVGHQQMMTDAMRPLGLSLWQLTTPRPMTEAGGRLFVDVTRQLASPASRERLLQALGRSDPLIGDALRTIVDRGDVVRPLPDEDPGEAPLGGAPPALPEADPAVAAELIGRAEASLAALTRDIRGVSGPALLDLILADIQELRRIMFNPTSVGVIMAGMEAARWLDERLGAWLGEANAADALAQSVPGNVTSEMGLALLDVADAIRPHPEVVAFLERVDDDGFLDRMDGLAGGRQARDAIRAYLDRYGMRCVGEIDVTRPRWSERPTALVPLILANVRSFAPGEAQRRVARGLRTAHDTERRVLERLRALPDGERRAREAKRMIDRLRAFSGYREYPKYAMVSRYLVYKRALLDEAARLARVGVLREPRDIFHLRFEELQQVVRTHEVDEGLIRRRRDAFRRHQALTPPRVMTSAGEVVAGAYRRDDVPAGALAGLAVSAGATEGRARVVRDIAEAGLEPGDILVTTHTDPSWSPAFVAIAGLVTEVGGLMTHGAVIAREYGLPAVVGVEGATRLIRDGQRIRVDGTRGWVEVLPR